MSTEIVRHETIPYDLAVHFVMGEAELILTLRHNRLFPGEQERAQIHNAAAMLSPSQPEKDPLSFYSRQYRELRLADYAREALAVPEFETEDNVKLLLGRASITLDNLAGGKTESESDIDFTAKILASMSDVGALRGSMPTDVVIAPGL